MAKSATVELLIKLRDEVSGRLNNVNKGLKTTQDALRSLGDASRALLTAGAAITAANFFPTAQAADFEAKMSQVNAVLDPTTEDFLKLEDAARQMGETTQFTARDAADAIKYLGMAGLNSQEALTALPGTLQLAAAGGLDLAEAADLATNVLAGMNLPVEELTRVNDALAFAATNSNTSVRELAEAMKVAGPAAAASGESLEGVVSVLSGLANSGIKGANAGQQYKRMLLALAEPTDRAKTALEKYNIETTDAIGRQRELSDVLEEVGDKEVSLADASNIFGRYAATAALAAGKQADAIQKLREGLDTAQGSAERMAQTMLDNAKGSFTIFKSALESLFITVGKSLLPAIRSLTDVGTKLVQFFTNFYKALGPIGPLVTGMVATIGILMTALGGLGLGLSAIGLGITQVVTFFGAFTGAAGTAAVAAGTAGAAGSGAALGIAALGTALKGVALALVTTPLGWFITILGGVAAAVTASSYALAEHQRAVEENGRAIQSAIGAVDAFETKIKNAKSEEEKQKAVDNLNDALKNIEGGSQAARTAMQNFQVALQAAKGDTAATEQAIQAMRQAMSELGTQQIQDEIKVLNEKIADIGGDTVAGQVKNKMTRLKGFLLGLLAFSPIQGMDEAVSKNANHMADTIMDRFSTIKKAILDLAAKGKISLQFNEQELQNWMTLNKDMIGELDYEWQSAYEDLAAGYATVEANRAETTKQTASQLLAVLQEEYDTRKRLALEAKETEVAAEKAVAEARANSAAKAAPPELLAALDQARIKSKEAGDAAKEAADKLKEGFEGAKGKAQEAFDAIKAKYDTNVTNITQMYDKAIAAAQSSWDEQKRMAQEYADKIAEIENKIAGIRQSTADKIRAINQKTMTDAQKWEDDRANAANLRRQAEEAATTAAKTGVESDFKRAEDLAKKARDAFADLAREVTKTNDEGQKESVKTLDETGKVAKDGVQAMGDLMEGILKQQGKIAEGNKKATEDAADKAKDLVKELTGEKELKLLINQEALDKAKEQIDAISKMEATMELAPASLEKIQADLKTLTQLQADLQMPTQEELDAKVKDLKVTTEAELIMDKAKEQAQSAFDEMKSNLEKGPFTVYFDPDTKTFMDKVNKERADFEGEEWSVKMTPEDKGVRDAIKEFEKGSESTILIVADANQATTTKKDLAKDSKSMHVIDGDGSRPQKIIADLKKPTSSTHTIYVRQVEKNALGGLIGDPSIPRFAEGGLAFRRRAGHIPGWGTEDDVPSLLMKGEYVVRKDAVKKYGVGFLHALNGMRLAPTVVPKFATGGLVGSLEKAAGKVSTGTGVWAVEKLAGAVRKMASGGSVLGIDLNNEISAITTKYNDMIQAAEREKNLGLKEILKEEQQEIRRLAQELRDAIRKLQQELRADLNKMRQDQRQAQIEGRTGEIEAKGNLRQAQRAQVQHERYLQMMNNLVGRPTREAQNAYMQGRADPRLLPGSRALNEVNYANATVYTRETAASQIGFEDPGDQSAAIEAARAALQQIKETTRLRITAANEDMRARNSQHADDLKSTQEQNASAQLEVRENSKAEAARLNEAISSQIIEFRREMAEAIAAARKQADDEEKRAINSRSGGSTSGSRFQFFNQGGQVPGAGNTDTVPAMLTPGEFVLKKSVVGALGSKFLHALNRLDLSGMIPQIQKFAMGGLVLPASTGNDSEFMGTLNLNIGGSTIEARVKPDLTRDVIKTLKRAGLVTR